MRIAAYSDLKKLLALLYEPRKLKVAASVFLSIFSGLTKGGSFIMLLPLLSLAGITDVAQNNSRALDLLAGFWRFLGISFTLYSSLVLYLALVSLYALLTYVNTLLETSITEAFKRDLRDELFSSVIRAEWGYLKNAKSSNIFNNLITEIEAVKYAGHLMLTMLGGIAIFLFYLITSFYVSFQMTLIASSCFLPLLFIQKRLNWRMYRLGVGLYSRHQNLFGAALEFVSSIKLAKSYNLQDRYEEEFNSITRQTARDNIQLSKVRGRGDLLYDLGFAIIICGLIVWALEFARIPVVDLLLMVYIAMKLLPSVSSLTRSLQFILNTLPAFSGIMTLLDETRGLKEITAEGLPVKIGPEDSIRLSGLCFGYESDTPVFENFDAEIEFNKTTALLGSSGRGKSTMVELLMGLLRPQAGKILIGGIELEKLNLAQWRSSIAYIPQECFLFHTTILKNLLWAKADSTADEIRAALESAGCGFVYELPLGLATVVGDQGIRLSGGERQRIALARALLRRPQILILDEATNALDDANEQLIKEAIDRLRGKATILIISHVQTLYTGADNIINLDAPENVKLGDSGKFSEL